MGTAVGLLRATQETVMWNEKLMRQEERGNPTRATDVYINIFILYENLLYYIMLFYIILYYIIFYYLLC